MQARILDYVSERIGAPLVAGTITERDATLLQHLAALEAGQGVVDYYDKAHPVPFAEYVPDRAFWRQFAPDLIDLVGATTAGHEPTTCSTSTG